MIVSAAVRFVTKDGKQFDIPCHRHADAFYIISQFLSSDEIDHDKTQQGFLDEDWAFYDRLSACEHAYQCHQIKFHNQKLFSEDLW